MYVNILADDNLKLVECHIQFSHFNPVSSQCIIEVDGLQTGIGVAHCSEDDQFNRKIGRKVALTRALADAGLPRDRRAVIWTEYFKTHKP